MVTHFLIFKTQYDTYLIRIKTNIVQFIQIRIHIFTAV